MEDPNSVLWLLRALVATTAATAAGWWLGVLLELARAEVAYWRRLFAWWLAGRRRPVPAAAELVAEVAA